MGVFLVVVARDIWFRKLNVRCWLEVISGRSCSNEYLKTANEVTISMYEKKFEYVFVTYAAGRTSKDILVGLKTHYRNTHAVELDIVSKEEMKYIELHITELLFKKSVQITGKGDVSAKYSGEIVNDTLDETETHSEDNLDDISSGGVDISRQYELNKVPEKESETL
ncbi:hypothetical protein Ahy_A02g005974 [Arachis hypogaea]|uniref:Oxo-4-hydroxy-4-carboxy-5-ureidoimidazoline decarboxylase domain-containing protein n=1 Tax=Arachis hypogaea TaxID=3818 RepID=A0A445E8G3_ARAHY|nr:hypothetical protein Ahy_A02g005974 [Arachis hypogaea]